MFTLHPTIFPEVDKRLTVIMSLCKWHLLKVAIGAGCGTTGCRTHWTDLSPDHKVRLINSFKASVRFTREMEVMMQEAQSVPIAHQSASPVAFLDITLKDSCPLPHKYVRRASSGVNVINALLRNGCHIKCRGRERRQVNEVESLTYGLNRSSCRLKDRADSSGDGSFALFVWLVWGNVWRGINLSRAKLFPFFVSLWVLCL